MFSPGDLLLAVHLVGVVLAVGGVAVTDIFTIVTELRPRAMKAFAFLSPFFSLVIWLGFLVLTATGIALLLAGRGNVADPMFQLKMGLTGVVFVNGIVLNELVDSRVRVYVERDQFALPLQLRVVASLSAGISIVGWWGALFVASFLVN